MNERTTWEEESCDDKEEGVKKGLHEDILQENDQQNEEDKPMSFE